MPYDQVLSLHDDMIEGLFAFKEVMSNQEKYLKMAVELVKHRRIMDKAWHEEQIELKRAAIQKQ